MKSAWLALILSVTTASAQTPAYTVDLAQWRVQIVGVPLPVDTDSNPATAEWLLRVQEIVRPDTPPRWASVVVQATADGPCWGVRFHQTTTTEPPQRLLTPRLWMVREGDVLHAYTLETPVCHR